MHATPTRTNNVAPYSLHVVRAEHKSLTFLIYLNCQELLRTRRPFYYIKYQEATSTGQLKLRQEEELRVRQETSRKEADTILKKLQEAHKEKKLRHMLDLVEKLKTYCDSKSKRILLDKDYYLDQMYAYVRRGFYELNRLTNEQYVWDQEKRIQYSFGLDISREPSRDSVISEFKNAFVDYKKREQLFEQRLKNASTSAEMCWCYHELSRCLIELKRHELARVYGKKCIQEGRNCHLEWVLNGTMLMAKINVQQHNKPDARKRIMSALNLSMELQDTILSDYLNMCLTVIEKIDFEGEQGPKVLEKREKNIVSMMVSAKMKEEVTHLFRMMSVMPASRRMLVMPGVRIEDIQKKSRNQSIVANQNKPAADSETTITSTISKRPHKKKSGRASSRGVGFMELIQYHMD